jgi:hypothetical protein
MKRLFASLIFLVAAAGCRAQLPVTTSYNVNYSATAPPTCTPANLCQIAYSFAAQVSGSCPATTAATYALACTSTSGTATCQQSTVTPGQTFCAIAQTVQGGANSLPTVPILVAIPAIPATPASPAASLVAVQTAQIETPPVGELQLEQLALLDRIKESPIV